MSAAYWSGFLREDKDMLLGYWIRIMILLALAYSTWQALTGHVQHYGWQHYYYLFAPWLLFHGALKGWYRAYTWRRMMYAQNISPDLSRGQKVPSKSRERKSALEKACLALLLLASVAIIKQVGMIDVARWKAFFSKVYAAFCFIINVVA